MESRHLIAQLDQVARTHPDAIAYDELGQLTSYKELITAANAIAAAIASICPDRTKPVLVYADQSAATVAAFLGSVKAGHAYIPVDVHSPNERLRAIVNIAAPGLIIATHALPEPFGIPVMTAETLETLMTAAPAPTPAPRPVTGDDPFYIIFTSGTTGEPKGVQVSHDNLLSFTDWMADFNPPAAARTLIQAPYSFDLSVMSLYPTLLNGGTLVVLPRLLTTNLGALCRTVPKLKLDVWVSTPSFMAMCLIDPDFDGAHHPTLRQIYFCGEELTPQLARKVLARFPNTTLYNTYGPTEATVAVSAVAITPDILARYPRLPIGYAKPDTQITLRPETRHTADGVTTGELEISGPSVALGYLNRPEKTAAAFGHHEGHRSYHSGDLGVITGDGLIFYRGRTDFQVKLNGFRIELEEVNHHLCASPHVRQAVAVPKYGADHKVSQLIAFVVPVDGETVDRALTAKIRADLARVMPSYMMPQRFVYRDSLPLTASDKVAIKLLIEEVNAS